MSIEQKIESAKPTPFFDEDVVDGWEKWIEEHDKQIRKETISEISREMRMLYGNEYEQQIRADERAEVIDEFVAKCEEKINEICNKAEDDIPFLDIFDIKKIAEQLKEQ